MTNAADESSNSTQVESANFRNLGLPEERLRVLDHLGFHTPTPIQAAAIPVLLDGRDVVGIAQTGTGKTAAFALPLLGRVDQDFSKVQALVLAPTRELALQTTSAMRDLAGRGSGIRFVTVYGGSSYVPQLRALKEGTQVVVGTPGRIIDLLERGALDLSAVRTLVLDEADEMLRMGFAEEVETILTGVPSERLTALFSATMPAFISKVAKKYLRNPERIEVTSAASTVSTITQTYCVVPGALRFEALCRSLSVSDAGAAIVFVRTRKDAEELSLGLSARGFRASGISGDVAQRERERLLEGLRGGALDVLVATDVAARGIDVDRVGLVVNYEVPLEAEQYVHRIGRTGRAGRQGESLTFFTSRDVRKLRHIERVTGSTMALVNVPTAAEVRSRRAKGVLDDALGKSGDVPAQVLELLDAKRDDGMRYRDIAAALLTQAARPRSLGTADEGEQARMDRQFAEEHVAPSKPSKRKSRDFSAPGKRYRIEVGKRDGANPRQIVGAITGEAGLQGSSVGKIAIYPSFSVVEVSEELTSSQMQRLDRATVRGRRLKIRLDDGARQADSREPSWKKQKGAGRSGGQPAARYGKSYEQSGGSKGRDAGRRKSKRP